MTPSSSNPSVDSSTQQPAFDLRAPIYAGAAAGALIIVLSVVYGNIHQPQLADISQLLYPIFWLITAAVAITAVWKPPSQIPLIHWVLGSGYFAVLLGVSGLLHAQPPAIGVSVAHASFGWGPVLFIDLLIVGLTLIPFQTAGYLTLSYLLVRAFSSTTRSLLASPLGILACVGCTAPLLGAVFSSLSVIAITEMSASYQLATGVYFLTTIILVYLIRDPTTCTIALHTDNS